MEGDPASGGAPVEGGMRDVDCDGPVVGLEAQIPTDRCGGALAIRESEVERVASAVCGGSADKGPQATASGPPRQGVALRAGRGGVFPTSVGCDELKSPVTTTSAVSLSSPRRSAVPESLCEGSQ